MFFAQQYLTEVQQLLTLLDPLTIERLAEELVLLRQRQGRLFILGVGGSAANASHAVNDFRKLCAIEAYTPTDNVAELTARVNDDGWDSTFAEWLLTSHLGPNDAVLALSVGGGNLEHNVSPNLVRALQLAERVEAAILGVVGRDGGYTRAVAKACVVVPTVNTEHTTPHTEAFQAVLMHLLVSHPALRQRPTKWESIPPSP